jgi:hypothetical protein
MNKTSSMNTNSTKKNFGFTTFLHSLFSRIFYQLSQKWADTLVVFILASTIAIATYYGAQQIDPIISTDNQAGDIWFEGDLPRVFSNMTDRVSNHYRTKVHPIFSLTAFPPVLVITKIFGLAPIASVRVVISVVAALWITTLFVLFRLIRLHRFDAILFSILATVSAAAMCWFIVPETYSFGSLTILLAFCFTALAEYYQFSSFWYVTVSAFTLSMTTTNWITGILMAIVNFSRKKALQITVNAFCLIVLLWSVQKFFFVSAVFFLGDREEKDYILMSTSGGPLQVLKSFVAHTMVLPTINIVTNRYKPPHWPVLSTQFADPGSGSIWGMVAVVLWTALLGLGIWGFFSHQQHRKLRTIVGLTLLGHLLLHCVYGNETFLYSLHFIPALIILAAFSVFTRARIVALLMATALILTVGVNNIIQINKAISFVNQQVPQRNQVLQQMQQRSQDPWPRSAGHVVLATPGSPSFNKAYHEPGGSFSPSVGSFGVSFWLTNKSGHLQSTNDTTPLNEIDQQLIWKDGQAIPSILTNTKYYQAKWSATEAKSWMLDLKTKQEPNQSSYLVIRSVGPAGGPINSLKWNGKKLLINQRWSLALDPIPINISLGEEGHQGWINETSNLRSWEGKNGWGYARFELADSNDWNLAITDSQAPKSSDNMTVSNTRAAIDLDVPDRKFIDSLNAQVAHLMMGLVGKETRPGEPINYPVSWQRDGAYTVVALARAGKIQEAKDLSNYFAENDFFGGFGSEADASGLSIWALEEVATRLKQPEYDQYIWPHVRRKAEFILEMMTTTKPILRPFTGLTVPKYKENPELNLVAEPARDDLIIGRMDWHRPLLFINAVSYRGLLDAASLANRLNQPADAQRWRDASAKLQQAWGKALQNPKEANNDRTYVSAIWPTWIGTHKQEEINQHLEQRWQKTRDESGNFRSIPLWTYFDIAEAHQWLLTDHPERSWATLRWFWNNQVSPGLYTWWEGNGEENTSNLWNNVRGWVKPPNVTPHYWTAAEMLLLQLDMLAYTDLATEQPTVVIGAGLSPDWLKHPINVGRLLMPNGAKLSWQWDGQQMRVKIIGEKLNVRLGSIFPSGTPISIENVL